MINTRRPLLLTAAAALATGIVLGGAGMQLVAAQQTVKRTVLQKMDIPGVENREAVLVLAEIPAGTETGPHTHPGIELGSLVGGSLVLEVEGRPATTMKVGDSWTVEDAKVHNGKSTGDQTARVLVTYIVEKGKPLASPAHFAH